LNAVAFLNNLERKCWHKLSVGSSSSIQEIHDNLLIHEKEEEEEEEDDDDDQRVSSDQCNLLNAVAFLNNLERKCWHKLSVGSSSSIQEIYDNLLIHEKEEEEEEDDNDYDDQRVSSDHFVSGEVLFLH
jgi:cytolysin (calcineurin-like family phosphatase)